MNWIKTTDRLPAVYIGYYIKSIDEFRALGEIGDCIDDITHWMPMPEAPK